MGKVTIKIREVATGRVVDCVEEVEDKYVDGQGFYYDMGNGCCDCNRKLMFGQAQGIEFTDEETPCGQSAYVVQVIIDGDIRLDEFGDN